MECLENSAAERLAQMKLAFAFVAHAAESYAFTADEQLVCDIKHLISLEDQAPEGYGLGILLSRMGQPMVDEYPELQAVIIEITG